MKKGTKITLTIVGVIAVALIALIAVITNDISQSPEKIVRKTGWRLPAYTVETKEDNLDRSASSWSFVEYTLKLAKPLSDAQIEELKDLVFEKRTWTHSWENDTYIFNNSTLDDTTNPAIIVLVDTKSSTVYVAYGWEDILS